MVNKIYFVTFDIFGMTDADAAKVKIPNYQLLKIDGRNWTLVHIVIEDDAKFNNSEYRDRFINSLWDDIIQQIQVWNSNWNVRTSWLQKTVKELYL
ncbi:hypothetical protein [Bacteroides sp.]|uniref:hypothetical protein n=1 Tax=Bacteroides sp. TaxID=29523 RepID=UPI0026130597|nr:hypothetical protein [Bacteroides sp.]MDD3039615.1 hypothetical protein [Bacteroides sp.]